MVKARDVHMNKTIRPKRDLKLKALDIEQLKGVDVTIQKQSLRDLPDTIDLTKFNSPKTLKSFIPAEVI